MGRFPIGLGWDPLLIYVDPRIGKPPNDIDPKVGGYLEKGPGSKGNGWLYPKIVPEADFDNLGLVRLLASPAPTGIK